MTESGETLLAGGRTTAGVVRIGDTVRRPPGPQSEFVAALLRGLRLAGFDAAPAPLERDDQGEMYSASLKARFRRSSVTTRTQPSLRRLG